jgi:hypothetical protein
VEVSGQTGILTAITATHAILDSGGQDVILANSNFMEYTSKQERA